MNKIDFILKNFFQAPIIHTGCLVVILLTIGVLILFILKGIEDPLKIVIKYLGDYLSQAIKEISCKAGYAGIMDLIIVILMFILAFSVLNNSSIASALGIPDNKSPVYALIIFVITAVVFIASLKMSLEHEKFEKLSKL